MELMSENSGNYLNLLVALMNTPIELAARSLHDAVAGAGTDERTLVEILCTTSHDDLQLIQGKYENCNSLLYSFIY